MTPAARVSAAIEVLADIEARRRPASDALKDWGLSHRFAGSGDRAAISAHVYDTLRRKASCAYVMQADTPRALVLASLRLNGLSLDDVKALCSGERFAPEPLTAHEIKALEHPDLSAATAPVQGDYPAWLDGALFEAFGEGRVAEAQAMTARAPVDLRVNTLLSTREEAMAALAHVNPQPTPYSPLGLRIAPRADGRPVSVQAEPAFQQGFVEIQDEASQLAALLTRVKSGETVIDLCAGGGGKTLALAALMQQDGRIFATDNDKRRLAPIFERMRRAGVKNVEVRAPIARQDEPLADWAQRADCVLIDAPCTGTGTWRRNPDAKWRMRASSFEDRQKDQAHVLDRAADLVKTGGRIVYVTCSLLPAENDGAIEAFLSRHNGFEPEAPEQTARLAGLDQLASFRSLRCLGLQMTPKRCATDGFFVSLLHRRA
jgi:16S rRNA (cytosine967-C5)-methyltransferase